MIKVFKKFKRNRSGQGLMELIVSLAVITVALTGTVSLTILNISGQRISEAEVIASNLAREAIEVIRAKRDSAWLTNGHFYDGNHENLDQQDHTLTVKFDDSINTWALDETVDTIDHNDAKLYLHPSNLYRHESSDGVETKYKRMVIIDYICQLPSDCPSGQTGICQHSEEDDTVCTQVDGQRITAKVKWQDKQTVREIELTDYLYNWR